MRLKYRGDDNNGKNGAWYTVAIAMPESAGVKS